MNKEPIALYIFRYIVGISILALIFMLYWAVVLLEEDVVNLQREIEQSQNELSTIRQEVQKTREDILTLLLDDQKEQRALLKEIWQQGPAHLETTPNPNPSAASEASYPNLLSPDPFYETTLPQLLGTNFTPQGTRYTATVGHPQNLHPLSNWSFVNSLWNNCLGYASQGEFGKFETFAPDLAVRIEARPRKDHSTPEFWVYLRKNVYWTPIHPQSLPKGMVIAPYFLQQHPVTAYDFKFYFDAIMNPFVQEAGASALRNYIGDITDFEVIDDHTFVVRWKEVDFNGEKKIKYSAKQLTAELKPLASWVYKYFPDGSKIVEDDTDPDTYRKNSVWAANFSQHWAKNIIISCGPWNFREMSENEITLERNPDFYTPLGALVNTMKISIKENPDSIWQDFKAGHLDSYELSPDQLIEWEGFKNSKEYAQQKESGLGICQLDYLNRAYAYIGWNAATPYFRSKKVRQAMTMAIDRNRIIEQNLHNMGIPITGPFFCNSPSYDKSIKPWAYDPQRSQQILEEEGWYDSDGDGIRDRNIDGKIIPLRFRLTYYVKNPTAKTNCEYVRSALQQIGVDCLLNGVDIADLSSSFEDKSFDAIHLGWGLGSPPEEPKQLWHSSGAKEKGSSNAVGFANAEADAIIDGLQYEYNPNERLKLYHQLHRIIYEEAPYTFLYTPKSVLLYREYVQNVFIPAQRQDLIPGANVAEPSSTIWSLKRLQTSQAEAPHLNEPHL